MRKKKATSWKEERRKRARALYQAGWKQKDIAEALGATKGAVSQWIKKGKEGGEAALKDRPKPGAPRRKRKNASGSRTCWSEVQKALVFGAMYEPVLE